MRATVIIMTSNIGSKELAVRAGDDVLGFLSPNHEDIPTARLKDIAVSAAKQKFLPEFLNRLDGIVMFNALTRENLSGILQLELTKLRMNIISNAKVVVELIVTPAAEQAILDRGYDRKYGARYLKRTIERYVAMPVTRAISTGQAIALDTIIVDFKDDFIYSTEST